MLVKPNMLLKVSLEKYLPNIFLVLWSKQFSSIIVFLNTLHIIYEITWLTQVHAYQNKNKENNC